MSRQAENVVQDDVKAAVSAIEHRLMRRRLLRVVTFVLVVKWRPWLMNHKRVTLQQDSADQSLCSFATFITHLLPSGFGLGSWDECGNFTPRRKNRFHMKRIVGVIVLVFALLCGAVAFAGTSLRLSMVLPGWDKLRSGPVVDAMEDLARGYARQLSEFCFLPEVFLSGRTTSISSAELRFTPYLPYGAQEDVLLQDSQQRLSVVYQSVGEDALTVMHVLRGQGVALAICGL